MKLPSMDSGDGTGGLRLDNILPTHAESSSNPRVSMASKIIAADPAISKSDWHLRCAWMPTLLPIFINRSPMVLDWQLR